MHQRLSTLAREWRVKVHLLALGTTLGVGASFLSQGCALSGQCAACGQCATRLPLLVLPLLVDGAGLLVLGLRRWWTARRRPNLAAPDL